MHTPFIVHAILSLILRLPKSPIPTTSFTFTAPFRVWLAPRTRAGWGTFGVSLCVCGGFRRDEQRTGGATQRDHGKGVGDENESGGERVEKPKKHVCMCVACTLVLKLRKAYASCFVVACKLSVMSALRFSFFCTFTSIPPPSG